MVRAQIPARGHNPFKLCFVRRFHSPVAVQSDDIERHRGDVHGEPLGVGQQEAEGAAKLPLPLQRVDEGEGEAQRVHQQVGWK